MFKLGEMVKDKALGLKGMLTHFIIQSDGSEWYSFQPKLLNKDTGQPVKSTWLTKDRIIGGKDVPEPELPRKVLGTPVEDKGTGFGGTCTAIKLHINGCVHLDVQPKGLQKNGNPIEAQDFDIRRCTGPMIDPVEKKELEKSKKDKPSPDNSCARR